MDIKQLTDEELVEEIKEKNCSDSLNELTLRHSALCFKICKDHSGMLGSGFIDVFDEKPATVHKAALSYNKDKGAKFSTWLGRQVKFHCLHSVNKTPAISFEIYEPSLSAQHQIQQDQTEQHTFNDTISYVMYILDQFKDPRIKEIFMLRFFSGTKSMSYRAIGKEIKMSGEQARTLFNFGRRIILNKLNKNSECDVI